MLENKIQAECFALLNRHGIFAHSVPNEGGGRSAVMQGQLVAMGLRKGVADMVVWWSSGIGYVEFKTSKGKQSEAQKTFERLCHERGISYDIVRSVDDMEKLILYNTNKKTID